MKWLCPSFFPWTRYEMIWILPLYMQTPSVFSICFLFFIQLYTPVLDISLPCQLQFIPSDLIFIFFRALTPFLPVNLFLYNLGDLRNHLMVFTFLSSGNLCYSLTDNNIWCWVRGTSGHGSRNPDCTLERYFISFFSHVLPISNQEAEVTLFWV